MPGAVEALAAGLRASVRQGTGGLWPETSPTSSSRDSTSRAIDCPVRTFHGAVDGISPPEVGAWLVARLPKRSSTCLPTPATTCSSPGGGASCGPSAMMRGSERTRG